MHCSEPVLKDGPNTASRKRPLKRPQRKPTEIPALHNLPRRQWAKLRSRPWIVYLRPSAIHVAGQFFAKRRSPRQARAAGKSFDFNPLATAAQAGLTSAPKSERRAYPAM